MTNTIAAAHDLPPTPVDLNSLLLPVLRSRHHSDSPASALARVLCRALANGVSPVQVLRWLVSYATPEQMSLMTNRPAWFRLVSSARRHVSEAATPEGVAKLRLGVARLAVARVLTPIEPGTISMRMEVNCRVALLIIAGEQIANGWSNQLVSAPWLAARIGLSEVQARTVLKTLETTLRWMRRDGQRAGALKYRLTRLGGKAGDELRDRSWLHADAIDAWANGDFNDSPLAALLASAAHPAWHYSSPDSEGGPLGSRGLLAAIHTYSGLTPDEGLGLSRRSLSQLQRAVRDQLPGIIDAGAPVDLPAVLDALGQKNESFAAREVRDEQLRADAAKNRIRVDAHRAEKARVFEGKKAAGRAYRKLISFHGPLGRVVPMERGELAAWVSQAAALVNVEGSGVWVTLEWRVFAREYLVRYVVSERGHSEADAVKAAAFVYRDAGVD